MPKTGRSRRTRVAHEQLQASHAGPTSAEGDLRKRVEDLQAANAELAFEVEELRRANRELEGTLESSQLLARRFASFPQGNPNPVLEVSTSGEITYANPASGRVLEAPGSCQKGVSRAGPDESGQQPAPYQSLIFRLR